ncbi:MAG: M28 family peptidase [Candidatus Thiodiazotropha sp. (ex Monitilora ramsayi)]|nr:M28 family peptidase [Candidatus Thiodiazotropha sp. (ex Monitilora ramsayi)]
MGYEPEKQTYSIGGINDVENIIAGIGPHSSERIVIGAHYDTYGNQPGADDNASGVAGLLMLARMLKAHERDMRKRIEFVAYTLEEPPFFRSKYMGSYVHAKSLKDNDIELLGMISLEMIGYYQSDESSQEYPIGLMKLFYPDTGNFIGIVSNISSRGFKKKFSEYTKKADINVETLSAPSALVGVDFSDHINYWSFGYDAIMVTDTAFYRNPNYHQHTDTIETLDFEAMSEAVRAVFHGLHGLSTK